ncbi:MAG: DUF1259 domain-containing protein [Gammaproteobacteria bacterium]
MNARFLSNKVAVLTLLLVSNSWTVSAVWAEAQTFDTAKIEQLTGVKGKLNDKEGVFKVAVPRSDLHVAVAGVHLTPPMGLTSWAAFTKDGEQTLVMGDMVLLEDQVNPVMSVALDQGLEVTALHNHFFWDSPRVMFMHIGGRGNEGTLAAAVGKVFAKINETSEGKAQAPRTELDPAKTSLDPKKIEGILGVQGEMTDGVYKLTWGRTTKMGDHTIGNAMGVNTWAAFVGSDEQAVVDGDFAMYEDEIQAVLKALRRAGINIVAIHSHMSMESPKVAFLHYWGIGSTTELAKALKSALDTQRKTP